MVNVSTPRVEERLASAALYVRAHLDEPLTVEQIGSIAGFSAFHFHRIFRVAFGENLYAYVMRHRMLRAGRELRTTDRSVIDIAMACGYDSHSSFSRAFDRAYGMSPSSYRKAGHTPRIPAAGLLSAGDLPDPAIVEVPARDVLAVRFTGSYAGVAEPFRQLLRIARRRGFIPGAAVLGCSYGSPDLEEHATLRFDACVTMVAGADVDGAIADGLQRLTIPGGRYAVYRHRGPFDRTTHAYDRLVAAWILTDRFRLRDAPFVSDYLSDPAVTPPDELECDCALPIS